METSQRTTDHPVSTSEPFAQQWSQLREQVKTWWDRLTDADLDQVAGNKDQLIRMLQARYGYARERAEQEVERRLREAGYAIESSGVSRLAEAAAEAGTTAQKMAATAAATVADTVTRAGASLPGLPGELVGLIRRYPVPSLMVGLGLGFLLGRSLGRTWPALTEEAGSRQSEAGYPEAIIQCTRCGQMVRQADMVSHSTTCSGPGLPGHGGSPT